jgi:aryl-alcohol dehydrogenase-like predicted oxidoreductase
MLHKLILGTVQFGLDYGINNRSGKPTAERVSAILDLAFQRGIRILDTAEAYGNAQEVIGDYHRTSSNRFKIVTKYSAGRNDLPDNLPERVAQDLKTLNVDQLYGYMFHSWKDFEMYYDRYRSDIESLKEQGLIKKFGVSVYTNSELESLLAYPVDLVQLPFNMLDNQAQRGALIAAARQKGMEVHTRSVFLQGLFFMEPLPEKLKALKPYLKEVSELSNIHGLSLADIALNYAVQQEQIDQVLIGVDTVAQLNQNLESLDRPLSGKLIAQLDQINVKEHTLLNPSTWNS